MAATCVAACKLHRRDAAWAGADTVVMLQQETRSKAATRVTARAVPMMAKSRISRGSGLTLALQCRHCVRLVSCGTGANAPTSAAQVPDTPNGKSPPSAFSSGALRSTPLLRQANAIAPMGARVSMFGEQGGRSQRPHMRMPAARAMTSFARCFWSWFVSQHLIRWSSPAGDFLVCCIQPGQPLFSWDG